MRVYSLSHFSSCSDASYLRDSDGNRAKVERVQALIVTNVMNACDGGVSRAIHGIVSYLDTLMVEHI